MVPVQCVSLPSTDTQQFVTVTGMISAVNQTVDRFQHLRSDENYLSLHQEAEQLLSQFKIDAIALPRQPRPFKRLDPIANQHTFQNAAEYFKSVYFAAVDMVS